MTAERCGLGSLLPSSCRGRAEAFARRLQSRLRTLGRGTGEEDDAGTSSATPGGDDYEELLENESWKPQCSSTMQEKQPIVSPDNSDRFFDFDMDESNPGSPANEEVGVNSHDGLTHCCESGCVLSSPTSNDLDSDTSSDGQYFDTAWNEAYVESFGNGLVPPSSREDSNSEHSTENTVSPSQSQNSLLPPLDNENNSICSNDICYNELNNDNNNSSSTSSLNQQEAENEVPIDSESCHKESNHYGFGCIEVCETLGHCSKYSSESCEYVNDREEEGTLKQCEPVVTECSETPIDNCELKLAITKENIANDIDVRRCVEKLCSDIITQAELEILKLKSLEQNIDLNPNVTLEHENNDKIVNNGKVVINDKIVIVDISNEDSEETISVSIPFDDSEESPIVSIHNSHDNPNISMHHNHIEEKPKVVISKVESMDNPECKEFIKSKEEINTLFECLTIREQNSESSHSQASTPEDERPRRIQRSSSLKSGKTPPGTPGRKKIVRFADVLGLDLADVRTFMDDVPKVPSSAYWDLQVTKKSDTPVTPSKCLVPMFQQPVGSSEFLDRVRSNKVCLENAFQSDSLSITGTVRVLNIDFHKSVYIRYTLDCWGNFADLQASYVQGSSDGFSDKFSFVLYGHTLDVGQRIEFAIKYTTGGQLYWDSNGGVNYAFQCLASTVPIVQTNFVNTRDENSPDDDRWASFY